MAHPKRKKSKSRSRMRKSSHRHEFPSMQECSQCGAKTRPHHACPSCGYYKGRQVVSKDSE